jgi:hypothetical protein
VNRDRIFVPARLTRHCVYPVVRTTCEEDYAFLHEGDHVWSADMPDRPLIVKGAVWGGPFRQTVFVNLVDFAGDDHKFEPHFLRKKRYADELAQSVSVRYGQLVFEEVIP